MGSARDVLFVGWCGLVFGALILAFGLGWAFIISALGMIACGLLEEGQA